MSLHRIQSVDIIPIFPRLASRYADRVVDMYGIEARLIFRIQTNSGLVGWGDQRVRPWFVVPDDMGQNLVGRDPFDFLNSQQAGGLNTALYDLMGKCLEIPAWKLMGPKCRDWVPVAAWTRPASPEQFAAEIQRSVKQGYRVFKIHTCSYHDVFEQTRAAEAVAPDGFKIHYDFNHNRTLGAVLPIVAELERNHPIVAFIEDPLVRSDIEGWRALRQQTRLPIIMHGTPMGGMQEYKHDMADAYMLGGSMFDMMSAGFALGRANLQVILQHESGTLGKAMAMHMGCVMPTHTSHSINLEDQYEEDVTTATIPIVDGSSPVPTGIGLGFEVDESAVQRCSQQKLTEPPRHIGILHMSEGVTWYGKGYVSPSSVTGTEEAGVRGFRSELWEEDGTSEFEAMFTRVEKEGRVRAS
jgi:L-alanine-DL-glutamate epimerase-like enolase superfamily enzyme